MQLVAYLSRFGEVIHLIVEENTCSCTIHHRSKTTTTITTTLLSKSTIHYAFYLLLLIVWRDGLNADSLTASGSIRLLV